jgi:hypothetical protein
MPKMALEVKIILLKKRRQLKPLSHDILGE